MGAVTFYYYYYYFFDDLYYFPDIRQAFKNICMDKMLTDGYFDMSVYIFGRIKKEDMHASLAKRGSKYTVLYQNAFPKYDRASEVWRDYFPETQSNRFENDHVIELTRDESIGIVNWVYRTMKDSEERMQFTRDLLSRIKELNGISNDVRMSKGIVYNAEKIELHFCSSVSGLNRIVASLKSDTGTMFFRGHSDANYVMCPSVMRSSHLEQNESKIYNELQIECPQDFEKCHTHLEVLVKMQHYGLPTRLLDITKNPLVALFFACESRQETYGEIILISAEDTDIKYPNSDTVSILASIPAFSYEKQQEFKRKAKDCRMSHKVFNQSISRLLHEVRLEKPAFLAEINREDILSSYIVLALKSNNRIVKQDGAFILCGLDVPSDSLQRFRYQHEGKKVVVLIEKKRKVLEELETYSVNRATLFPEIECVAEYLKNKYI